MIEKTSEKVKGREKRRTGKLLSSFVLTSIVLSVLAASVATVSAPDVQQPQLPKITKITVTANPTSILADGISISNITASTVWENVGDPNGVFWINFTITSQPGGATLIPSLNKTDSAGKAYTQLISGTNAGNVVIKASSEGAGWYIENTTTVTLVLLPTVPRWDINEDCTVNYLDLGLLAAHWGESPSSPYPRWDINEDGAVNYLDLGLLAMHWGETTCT